jgi:hypothetical protein
MTSKDLTELLVTILLHSGRHNYNQDMKQNVCIYSAGRCGEAMHVDGHEFPYALLK